MQSNVVNVSSKYIEDTFFVLYCIVNIKKLFYNILVYKFDRRENI